MQIYKHPSQPYIFGGFEFKPVGNLWELRAKSMGGTVYALPSKFATKEAAEHKAAALLSLAEELGGLCVLHWQLVDSPAAKVVQAKCYREARAKGFSASKSLEIARWNKSIFLGGRW